MRSAQAPCHSRSTYSAPSASASLRMARRSSSDPWKYPPCAFGRQVTITGLRRPARAAAALGSRTVSNRSSIRSASVIWSRRVRSSAVVSAVTVTHNFAGFTKSPNHQIPNHQIKKAPLLLKRRFGRASECVLVLHTDRVASPVGHQYHHVPYDTDPVFGEVNPVEVTARERI